jgi:hypothetical protein
MNSESDNESESSLPTHPVHIFPSSPPVIKQSDVSFEKLETMDNTPQFKSEPPAAQHNESSKPPPRSVSSEDTERPPSAQQAPKNMDGHSGDEDEDADDDEDMDSDPAEQISEFDWDDLHQRYHDAMKGCHEQEGELTQEWESLMNV